MSKKEIKTKFSLLFIFEVFAKNTISVLQISLMFYLTKELSWNSESAFKSLAAFGMISYSSPLFAGFLTDKILGQKKAMILGLFIMLIGSVFALYENTHFAVFGIVLIGVGSGFFKPNILTLLDNLFKKKNEERSLFFGRFYLASSVGEIFAVIASGILAEYFLLYNPFYISIFSILTVLILFYSNRGKFSSPSKKIYVKTKHLYLILMIPVFLYLSILYGINEILLVISFTALIGVIRSYTKDSKNNKRTTWKILIMILYGVLFFSLTVQCYFSLNLAIENYVDRRISDNIVIPTYWFLLINPLSSLLIGNYVSEYYKKHTLIYRMIHGFGYLSLGYFILFTGFYYSGIYVNMGIIVVSYIIFIVSSFTIIPQLISELTYHISSQYKSRGVGVWYLTMAFSQYLAGYIANFIHKGIDEKVPRDISLPLLYIFSFSIIFSIILRLNVNKLTLVLSKTQR